MGRPASQRRGRSAACALAVCLAASLAAEPAVGEGTVLTIAGSGAESAADGVGTYAGFSYPAGIAVRVAASGGEGLVIFVADKMNGACGACAGPGSREAAARAGGALRVSRCSLRRGGCAALCRGEGPQDRQPATAGHHAEHRRRRLGHAHRWRQRVARCVLARRRRRRRALRSHVLAARRVAPTLACSAEAGKCRQAWPLILPRAAVSISPTTTKRTRRAMRST